LSKTHILKIVQGLHDFKFQKKISEEISFVSKISERETAAFNFTLDESLSLKRHHKKLLKDLEKRYENTKSNEFINSKSFAHMIFGDLHFYDEEYNDAIIEYMEAIQVLRDIKFSSKNSSLLVLLIRNMLKLGYTLERRKSYNSAFMIYSQLVSYIVEIRDIDLERLGLKEKTIKKGDFNRMLQEDNLSLMVDPRESTHSDRRLKHRLNDNKVDEFNVLVEDRDDKNLNEICYNDKNEKNINLKDEKSDHFSREIKLRKYNKYEDNIVCLSEDFLKLINEKAPFTKLKETIYNISSSFETIRLIYQPLIAKLQMIEKALLGYITIEDLKRIEKEYNYITRTINYREKFIIGAEFWCKVADILYFKNGLLPEHLCTDESNITKQNYYLEGIELFAKNKGLKENVIKKGYNCPCAACKYYIKSLKILCYDFLGIYDLEKCKTEKDIFLNIFFKTEKGICNNKNSIALKVLANTLSGLGNTFLSCCFEDIVPSEEFIESFLNFVNEPVKNFKIFFGSSSQKVNGDLKENDLKFVSKNLRKFNKIEEVFLCYFLSHRIYIAAGDSKESTVQILKILYLFRNIIRINDNFKKFINKYLGLIEEVFLKRALKNLYRAYGSIHRLEIEDYKRILNYSVKEKEKIDITDISLKADLREFIIVFQEIKIISISSNKFKKIIDIFEGFTVNSYSSIKRMYNRILDLRLKTMINYNIFKLLGFDDLLDDFKFKNGKEVELESAMFKLKEDNQTKINHIKKIISKKNLKENDYENLKFIFEFLVKDSIFCLMEIIKLIRIYGISYMINYSILANTHKWLGDWCHFYHTYFDNSDEDTKMNLSKDLSTLIGRENLQFLGTRYHYEKSREAYYSIFELHSEGKAYRRVLENMFYLNDDFNDTFYHFNAAAERYRINTGNVRKSLDYVKNKIKGTILYDYDIYSEKRNEKD